MLHPDRPDKARFRNPNGVALKLANFRAVEQPGHGMARGGKLDAEIWNEFSSDRERLRAMADAIRADYGSDAASAARTAADETDESEFPEGRVVYRLHRARERNRQLVERKKAHALKQHGTLACEACGFDFAARYGKLGKGYIECHHIRPLSELAKERTTKVNELVLVCSNCHRMLHRRRPWLTAAQLSHLLS